MLIAVDAFPALGAKFAQVRGDTHTKLSSMSREFLGSLQATLDWGGSI